MPAVSKATGLEVNSGWWESGYSTPHFVPLVYTEAGVVPELPSDSALLFSYFNNMEYFEEYLAAYGGDCVILIGPVDGKRHCAPEPSYLAEAPKHAAVWRLAASHDVRAAGEDEVSVCMMICYHFKSILSMSRKHSQMQSCNPLHAGRRVRQAETHPILIVCASLSQ